MSTLVLDSSAILAFVFDEPGAGMVAEHMDADAAVSALNWSEVVQKLAYRGKDAGQLAAWVLALGPQVEPFDREAAEAAAALYPGTVRFGLSLGDRAALTLAQSLDVPVLTADRTWAEIPDAKIHAPTAVSRGLRVTS